MHLISGTMNISSIWRKQGISVHLMSHYTYLMLMKWGSPWPTKVLAGKGDLHVYQQGSSLLNGMALYISLLVVYQGCNFVRCFWRTSIQIFHWLFLGTQKMGGWMPIYSRNGSKNFSFPKWKSSHLKTHISCHCWGGMSHLAPNLGTL